MAHLQGPQPERLRFRCCGPHTLADICLDTHPALYCSKRQKKEAAAVSRKSREYRFTFTFLIYPCESTPGKYVAHCLELDVLAVQANRPRAVELLKELIEDLIEAAIADGTLDRIFKPAPEEYWQVLAHSSPYEPPERVRKRHIKARRVQRVRYAQAPRDYALGAIAPA